MKFKTFFFLFILIVLISSCSVNKPGGGAPKKEAKPELSEPVPGAEILIEQEQNDIPQPKKQLFVP